MTKTASITFFFTLYVFIAISNIASVLGFVNSKISLIVNYGGFIALLIAFILAFSLQTKPSLAFLYKKNFRISLFVLIFYLVGVVISMVYMNFDSLIAVIPNIIRCTLSVLIFPYLFSYFLLNKKGEQLMKIFAIILTMAVFSIVIFNFLGIELSYLVYTDLQDTAGDVIGRSSGVFLNANSAGQFAVYAVIFLLYLLEKERKKAKYLICIPLAFCIFAVFMTFSTTGFINILLALTYYIFNKYTNKIKFIIHFVFLLITFQVLLSAFISVKDAIYKNYNLPAIQQEKIDNIVNILSFSDSKKIDYSDRDQLLQKGIERVEKRPFFGYGAGEFMAGIAHGVGVHNTYIQIIGETGVFMLLFYLVICFQLLKTCFFIKNKALSFLATSITLSTLIYQLTTHGILYNETILLIVIFISCLSTYVTYIEKRKPVQAPVNRRADFFDVTPQITQ